VSDAGKVGGSARGISVEQFSLIERYRVSKRENVWRKCNRGKVKSLFQW
jgi:hypothetical protein